MEWRSLASAIAQAPLMRLSPDGGVTFPRWRSGPGRRKREQTLTARLPNEPATVPVFDQNSGTGRLLVADFDVKLARRLNVTDPVRRVAEEAASFAALVERLGGRVITDVSPAGGRHVYVLFATELPHAELWDTARALARRYPTMDVSPMSNTGGQIRPPGAPHKLDPRRTGQLTGWLRLTMPLGDALRAARTPCGHQVWNALQQELTGEYISLGMGTFAPVADDPALAGLPHDSDTLPWVPRRGGRKPLRELYADIAVTGTYDTGRYPSGSEARLAVMTAAAAMGWRHDEVVAQMNSGAWPGLLGLYGKYRSRAAKQREWERDWRKAVRRVQGEKPGRNFNTSPHNPSPPIGEGLRAVTAVEGDGGAWRPGPAPVQCKGDRLVLDDWQIILTWYNCIWIAERTPEQRNDWGRAACSIRKLLRAVGVASQMSGQITTKFGVRYLSLLSGIDYTTVAKLLQRLRTEPDPWITLERSHYRDQPDYYAVRIPDRYREAAMWRRWRSGLIDAIHPVFKHLPAPAAFAYEALSDVPAASGEIARRAALSRTAATDCLGELAANGLAERDRDGWRRGPTTLAQAAAAAGATTEHDELTHAYARHRQIWRDWLAELDACRQPASGHNADPDPGYGTPIDLLAQQEPPDWLDHDPGPADHLPSTPADHDDDSTRHDSLTQADLAALGHVADLYPPLPARRTRHANRPATRQPDASRPGPPAEHQLDVQLQTLISELGGVIIDVIDDDPGRTSTGSSAGTPADDRRPP